MPEVPTRVLARLLRRRQRIYLHIGAMKTGTTYLQSLMSANREELARAGYLFPGKRWSDQSRAVREILFQPPADPRVRARNQGKWQALRSEALAHRGRGSIVSMEFLSFADAEQAERIVSSLEGLEVHVILTVRDAQSALPAQWQTACRNGNRVGFQKFIRGARQVVNGNAPQGRGARLFERTQGVPRMLEVWTPLVGPKRMHVITVPPRGADPDLLWQRFAKAVGVRPKVAARMPDASNLSLGHPSSELLRRVNAELGSVPTLDYWKVVKGQLGRAILGSRSRQEPRVRLHRGGVRLARRWNAQVREAIDRSGVRVIGDLDDLPVGPIDDRVPAKLYRPGTDELLAAAETAYAGMLGLRSDLATRAGLPEPPAPASPDWRSADDPVGEAVRSVTGLVRECIDLRHGAPEEDEPAASTDDDSVNA